MFISHAWFYPIDKVFLESFFALTKINIVFAT